MRTLLFVEDLYEDFMEFTRLFEANGFMVFPRKDEIKSQKDLNSFLGKNFQIENFKQYNEKLLISLKKKIFKYLKDKKLYEELSLIVLDINLIKHKNDTLGLDLLTTIRSEFKADNNKYKEWSKIIPVIALTAYNPEDYKEIFKSSPGYLLGFHNKDDIRNSSKPLSSDLVNFHEQMSAIYPLFYDPELKKLLSIANRSQEDIQEIKQITELVLYSQIAQMPLEQRNSFIDNFATELINHTKNIDGFMIDIEESEGTFKDQIKNVLESPPVKIAAFASSIISLTKNTIKQESITDFIEKFLSLLKELPEWISN